jgi:hypothetical protein
MVRVLHLPVGMTFVNKSSCIVEKCPGFRILLLLLLKPHESQLFDSKASNLAITLIETARKSAVRLQSSHSAIWLMDQLRIIVPDAKARAWTVMQPQKYKLQVFDKQDLPIRCISIKQVGPCSSAVETLCLITSLARPPTRQQSLQYVIWCDSSRAFC